MGLLRQVSVVGPLLADLIKGALCAGGGDLEPLSRSLDRTAGLTSHLEGLSSDPEIPGAAFLYYERRIALTALLEPHSPAGLIGTDGLLSQLVVDTVR